MAKRKKRIVITIVTEDSSVESSIIEGRELRDGSISAGPTEEQYAVAYKAIRELMEIG